MAKAPVHSDRSGNACDLPAEVPLQRRRPWDEAETESIVDHRETPGSERYTLTVDARDVLALRGRSGWQSHLCG